MLAGSGAPLSNRIHGEVMSAKSLLFIVLILGGLCTGCDLSQMVDSKVQAKAREYFPLAEVSHPRRDILTIKTHLGNITEKFAAQVMANLIKSNRNDLEMGLSLAGFRMFAVEFDEGVCSWLPEQPMYFRCAANGASQAQIHLYSVYGVYQ
jgi:hypothetical protein